MKLNNNKIVFTGGGTGGHIYPGLAIVDELKEMSSADNRNLIVYWLGCSKGMDKTIVERNVDINNQKSVDYFYGIPSGKLRRYFSFKNFSDVFKIIGGFFSSFYLLLKIRPILVFSKGGFVSVPPCLAAKILNIPVFTHECDFTLGLANRINLKSASKMFVSYEDTKNLLSEKNKIKTVVTGNPIRPSFYKTNKNKGFDFLNINQKETHKPILIVLGGSSGAKQINDLVYNNLSWLCENFIVVHQTGLVNSNEDVEKKLITQFNGNYKPYNFIYQEMPDVLSCADIILSRAGANSIWEAASLFKPMLLIPLCGEGTRGDQVSNASFFKSKNAAEILVENEANAENLIKILSVMINESNRKIYVENLEKLVGETNPAKKIAGYLYDEISLSSKKVCGEK